MKKILILLALLLVGGAGYYFGFGAEKATGMLKEEVETQLLTLQENGFGVEDRNVEGNKEHFVLHYNDPAKIYKYANSKNINISEEGAESLKGMKIGVDLSYLDGAYSALSADIYPVAYPTGVMQSAKPNEQKNLEKILQEKILLVHVDINKLLSAFKGNFKDIDTTFDGKDPLKVESKGFTFAGSFDDKLLTESSASIEKISVSSQDMTFVLKDLDGGAEQTGKSVYDADSKYTIKDITIKDKNNIGATIKGITLESSGKTKDDAVGVSFSSNVESIDIASKKDSYLLDGATYNLSLDNLSLEGLEKMRNLDPNDEAGAQQALKDLLGKGIVFNIDELSIKKITQDSNGDTIDGFTLNSTVKIDKIDNLAQIENNPFALLNLIDATAHIEFSDKLFAMLQKDPQLAMFLTLFVPIDENGNKVYNLEFKNGAPKVNGKPLR